MNKTSLGDIRQLAGFLEGEGFFTFTKRNQIIVGATSTDKDVLEFCQKHLGGWLNGPYKYKVTDKPSWRWRIMNVRASSAMMTLFPFMGNRRSARIKECLILWKTFRPAGPLRTKCKHGHLYDEENTIKTLRIKRGKELTLRSCRACQKDYKRRYRAKKSNCLDRPQKIAFALAVCAAGPRTGNKEDKARVVA